MYACMLNSTKQTGTDSIHVCGDLSNSCQSVGDWASASPEHSGLYRSVVMISVRSPTHSCGRWRGQVRLSTPWFKAQGSEVFCTHDWECTTRGMRHFFPCLSCVYLCDSFQVVVLSCNDIKTNSSRSVKILNLSEYGLITKSWLVLPKP